MRYEESNLLKLLEYSNLQTNLMLVKIAEILNLQFFKDDLVYTLGNEHFVIDIVNTEICIMFVEEIYQTQYKYIEYYFNYFYSQKKFIKFYNLLKFTVYYFSSSNDKQFAIKHASGICSCINTYEYCKIKLPNEIEDGCIYNIFTHRIEKHTYTKTSKNNLIILPEHLLNQSYSINLSECYSPCMLTKNIFTCYCKSFYKARIDEIDLFIDEDLKIYKNGKYDLKISFAFKRGINLKDCLCLFL